MKLLRNMTKDYLPKKQEPKLVHAVQDAFVLKYFDTPVLSNDLACPMCGGNKGYVVFIDPAQSNKRMWFCSDSDCLTKVRISMPQTTQTTHEALRSLEWPLFCELNHMGNLVYDVSFEKINQSSAKIEYLLKFAQNPKGGIILMAGDTGTGKTYACMGLCELFTRTSTSCLFFTADRLLGQWIDSIKSERPGNFRQKIEETNLLIIDDFGIGEPSPGFMSFLMGVINARTQWSNRGTVITTNVTATTFGKFCGEALSDRINRGQIFEFNGPSRRTQITL